MIAFKPYIYGLEVTLFDVMSCACEFETEEELKKYLYKILIKKYNNVNCENIIIEKRPFGGCDDRIGWRAIRRIYYRDPEYIKKYGRPIYIGDCTSKYRNLSEVLEELKYKFDEQALKRIL